MPKKKRVQLTGAGTCPVCGRGFHWRGDAEPDCCGSNACRFQLRGDVEGRARMAAARRAAGYRIARVRVTRVKDGVEEQGFAFRRISGISLREHDVALDDADAIALETCPEPRSIWLPQPLDIRADEVA